MLNKFIFALALVCFTAAAEDRNEIPSIEFACDSVGGLVFYNTGTLKGSSLSAEFVDLIGSTLYFTGNVRITGELVEDEIRFDSSTIMINGVSHHCTAQ